MSFFMQEGKITGQVMPGEAILENAQATRADTPLESVETLVIAYSRMAFRIAYSILRNHHDAEDAVQECFLRVLKHKNRLHKVQNPKTWIARIAWTTALDRRTGRAKVSTHEDAFEPELLLEFPDRRTATDDQLARNQIRELLAQMISTLPEDLRYPLELSTVQELNSAEIAGIMKIPEGSVRTRLMRARQRLRDKLSAALEAKRV